MYTEFKENFKKTWRISKSLMTPKTLIWIIVMSVLPIGIAMKWKEIKKEWTEKVQKGRQTQITEWAV